MTEYEEKMLAEAKKQTHAIYICLVILGFIAGKLMVSV
jgi:hypothetical protein